MIIVCVGGGLGNQMFQYAFYLSMKRKYPNHKVVLDINNIMEEDHNGYELDRIFHLPIERCGNWKSIVHSLRYPKNKPFFRVGNKLLIWKRKIVKHPHHIMELDGTWYNPIVDQIPAKGVWLLQGYWIHQGYHEQIAPSFPDMFQFPEFEDETNIRIASEMQKCNSVSIHVRHGDYEAAGLNVLGMDYYREAIKRIMERVDNPYFFIFSDEKREELEKMFADIPRKIIVSHNRGMESFRDMQLMSLCKHNIVANSTFSTWGALLNSNPGKIVISPDKLADKCKEGYAFPGWEYIHV